MRDVSDALNTAAEWHRLGETVAIAIVTETWGSSPCPPGSRMAVTKSGRIAGSVSGGCIEGAVAEAAQDVMRSGQPALLDFGVTNEMAWEVGLACGGKLKVFVEPLAPATLEELTQAQAARRPLAFAKRLADGAEFLLPDPAAPAPLTAAALAALEQDKTGTHTFGDEAWFIEARNPSPRLILVGAVHISQALAPMARLAGLDVILIDPRQAFGNADRFPGVELINDWPDTALTRLRPDVRTAIVTLTHDPKLDDPALDTALRSAAFYIGALGSRKTHAARLERLGALGHAADPLARIHAPVGLAIAAVTPAEIALSILAEIIAVRRGGAVARA
jgi:xanthine dehydrogenase accessory factor